MSRSVWNVSGLPLSLPTFQVLFEIRLTP
jgi:hypothetical protein